MFDVYVYVYLYLYVQLQRRRLCYRHNHLLSIPSVLLLEPAFPLEREREGGTANGPVHC